MPTVTYLGSTLGQTPMRDWGQQAVAEELRATANQVVLAWMAHSDPYVIPVFAASTVEQMRENLGALEIKLNAEQMARLNNACA